MWVPQDSAPTNIFIILVGYGVAIAGLIPGSRFWFDALSRLNSLRSTGAKPARGGGEE
jgi:energy-converting hydrogenase Eha subunit G